MPIDALYKPAQLPDLLTIAENGLSFKILRLVLVHVRIASSQNVASRSREE